MATLSFLWTLTMLHVYQTAQGKNKVICQAFAAGCGAPIVPPYPLLPGDMFCFGALRGLLPTLQQAWQEKRRVYYCDNGYFHAGRRIRDKGYYRVTVGGLQHDGTGTAAPDRWKRLNLDIKPWRKSGRHIVLCPVARLLAVILNIDADLWLKETLATLREHTDRPIRVRKKMSYVEAVATGGVPLSEDLVGAWALVTHSSNAAVEALLAGVPVFCTDPCGAYRMGLPDLFRIEAPVMPDDREQWAWNLAAAQWRLDEMRSGQCWRELTGAHPSDTL